MSVKIRQRRSFSGGRGLPRAFVHRVTINLSTSSSKLPISSQNPYYGLKRESERETAQCLNLSCPADNTEEERRVTVQQVAHRVQVNDP